MRTLLRFSLGFVAAALLTLTVCSGYTALAVSGLFLLMGLILCMKKSGIAPVLLGLSLGFLWTYGYQSLLVDPVLSFAGKTEEISGIAIDYSEPTTYGIRVPAELEIDGQTTRAMVWLYTNEQVAPGDAFTVTAKLLEADGEDSYYYRSEGIHLRAYGKGTPEIQKTAALPVRFFPRFAAHALEQSLQRCMPEDALGYAAALATGNRSGLTLSQKSALKTAGIYHMMALSGMHLTVLIRMVSLLFRRKKTKAVIGISVSVLFALVTGASASIVRAAVMQALVLLAPLLGREEDTPTSLGAAALMLTVQNPWCLFGLGLQLSFSSMAGILLLSKRIYLKLKGKRRFRGKAGRILSYVLRSFATSGAAMALSIPLLMLFVGRISMISPLSCLLTGLAVTWCFRGSLLAGLAGLVWKPAGTLIGWITAWPIRYVQIISDLLSRIPFASLNTGNAYFFAWVVFLYAVLLLTWLPPRKELRPVIPVCCLLLCLFASLTFSMAENQGTVMTALDVGQGQCLLFSLRGQTVMVDCGGSSGEATGDLAADRLSDMGEDRVDALILTHFDSDHIAGLEELLSRIRIARILIPDLEHPAREKISAMAASYGCEIQTVTSRIVMRIGSEQIIVLPPLPGGEKNTGLCVLVETEGLRALVTGDISAEQERLLINTQEIPPVDILVAGHHGAATSTSQTLLNSVMPRIVVISVGKNNYGHPADETLNRIHTAGAEAFRTDLYGTIVLKGG